MSEAGFQISVRCRIRGELGRSLHQMPHRLSSRTVSILLSAAAEGVDLVRLIEAREEVRRLGLLLNQSCLIFHRSGSQDPTMTVVVAEAVGLINALVRGAEDML